MKVCDICGSKEQVQTAVLSWWENDRWVDLCPKCAEELFKTLKLKTILLPGISEHKEVKQ